MQQAPQPKLPPIDYATNFAGNRRRIPWFGIALAVIVLGIMLASILLAMLNRMRYHRDPLIWDARNMNQIGQSLAMYAKDNHGQYPPRMEDLLLAGDITAEVFVSPLTNDTRAPGATLQQEAANLSSGGHESYIYIPNLNPSVDPRRVVLYEPLSYFGGHGMQVLYGDGHVEFEDAKQAAAIIAELKAGFNPPRPGHY